MAITHTLPFVAFAGGRLGILLEPPPGMGGGGGGPPTDGIGGGGGGGPGIVKSCR